MGRGDDSSTTRALLLTATAVIAAAFIGSCKRRSGTNKGSIDASSTNGPVVLHRFDPQKGAPYGDKSCSPFGIKVECFLRLCHIPYHAPPFSVAMLLSNPKRKLPVCVIDGFPIPDSTFILKHLMSKESRFHLCVEEALCDSSLTPAERGVGVALKALCEDHLYWIVGYWRYQWDPGFEAYRNINVTSHSYPILLRWALDRAARRAVLGQLWAQGTGRHNREEVERLGRDALDAIDAILGEGCWCGGKRWESRSGSFLFGAKPSSFDAILFACLSSIMEINLDSPLKEHAFLKQNVLRYLEHINSVCWDEN